MANRKKRATIKKEQSYHFEKLFSF